MAGHVGAMNPSRSYVVRASGVAYRSMRSTPAASSSSMTRSSTACERPRRRTRGSVHTLLRCPGARQTGGSAGAARRFPARTRRAKGTIRAAPAADRARRSCPRPPQRGSPSSAHARAKPRSVRARRGVRGTQTRCPMASSMSARSRTNSAASAGEASRTACTAEPCQKIRARTTTLAAKGGSPLRGTVSR